MILLKKINGENIYLNPHLMEVLEEQLDHTNIIFYKEKNTHLVKEKPYEIIDKIIEYRKSLGINGQEL